MRKTDDTAWAVDASDRLWEPEGLPEKLRLISIYDARQTEAAQVFTRVTRHSTSTNPAHI